MSRTARDAVLTAVAPVVWGSTYVVTTETLAGFSPVTVATLRALPAGLLLLALTRRLPSGIWWLRCAILGGLNISIFLSMLFVAAYRLPGGVAGTVLSGQSLIVVFLASAILSIPLRTRSVAVALAGMAGVALLVLTPAASLDLGGIAAGIAGAFSMALGLTLSRRWQPPVSPVAFAAWQLTAGGLLLVPVALALGDPIPRPSALNMAGLAWLALVGGALTYALWFRGVAKLAPSAVSALLFLSPLTAVVLGWALLGQSMSAWQVAGIVLVIGSVWQAGASGNSPRPGR